MASSFLILASNAREIPQVIAYNEPKILFEMGKQDRTHNRVKRIFIIDNSQR